MRSLKNSSRRLTTNSSRKPNIWIPCGKANSCSDFLRIRPINLSWLWNRRMQIQIMGHDGFAPTIPNAMVSCPGVQYLFLEGSKPWSGPVKIRLSNNHFDKQNKQNQQYWSGGFDFSIIVLSRQWKSAAKAQRKNNSEESERFLAILFPENELRIPGNTNRVVNVPIQDYFNDHLAEKFRLRNKPAQSKPSQKGTLLFVFGVTKCSL